MYRLPALSRMGMPGALLAAAVCAQPPATDARKAMQESLAKQAAAVAAMRFSIAKQRAALAASPVPPREESADGAFFTLSWPALGAVCEPVPAAQIGPLIQAAARQEGLREDLLRAVAEQESGFRPCAVSASGAMGLMQLMPATAREFGVRDPFDPQESLASGARYLKQLLTRFGGDTALALAAYNAGPARVEETGGVPDIEETVRYVQRILSRLPIP